MPVMNPRSRASTSPSASPALRELLATQVTSYEHLELVLALRDHPDGRSLVELARELQITLDVLHRVGAELVEQGMVELLPGASLRLTFSHVRQQLLAEAAALYAQDRTYLLRVQTSIAIERIRSHAARTFAEAFRIRKPRGEPVNERVSAPSTLNKLVVIREPR